MQRFPVPSSTLSSVGYSHRTSVLEVEFTSGLVYRYFAVPASIYEGLSQAKSKGAFFNERVRERYPFERLPGPGGG